MSPSDTPPGPERIKVTDRRAFTPEGERRRPEEPPSPAEPATPPVQGEGFTMREGPAEGSDLNSLVVWLSSIAFINLGGAESPVTGKVEVNLETARQMIDFLDILREKTRGNLTPSEAQLLDRVVELKLLYSRHASER